MYIARSNCKIKTRCACGHIDAMARRDTNLSRIKCVKCKKIGTTKYIKRHKTLTQFRLEKSGKINAILK